MDTLTVEITNSKAYKLLESLEDLKIIRVLRKSPNRIADLRGKIQAPMSDQQIDEQLETMRKEWQRDS